MIVKRVLGIAICLTSSFVFAQSLDVDTDPVLRAKAQRAFNNSQDLPPLPRGLTEPPPLPPPELHTHDIRAKRRSYTASSKFKRTNSVKKSNAGTARASAKKTPVAANHRAVAKTSSASTGVKKAKK